MSARPNGAAATAGGDDLAAAVRAIWARRRDSVLERVDVLDHAAAALSGDALDEGLREEAAAEAHRLAGTAGSFGFPLASDLARGLERALEAGAPLDRADGVRLGEAAARIRAELEARPAEAAP